MTTLDVPGVGGQPCFGVDAREFPALEQIRSILAERFGADGAIEIVSAEGRKFSRVRLVQLRTSAGLSRFVIKLGTADSSRQARLANRARDIFHDARDWVFQPLCFHDPVSNALVSEFFDGRSLQARSTPGVREPFWRSRKVLQGALERAGKWLRKYHEIAPPDPGPSPSFRRYFDPRRAGLVNAPPALLRRLDELVKTLPKSVVTIHGDFSPHNILLGAGRVCVIDFGIEEWATMSPAWDVATMRVALEKALYASRWRPLTWIHGAAEPLLDTFTAAYGIRVDDLELLVCSALRHVAGYVGEPPRSAMADWHLRKLACYLDLAQRA